MHLGKAVGVAAGVLVGTSITARLASALFRAQYGSRRDALLLNARTLLPAVETKGAAELPPPVSRYLDVTGARDSRPVKSAFVRQRGELRMSADKPWIPFIAEQAYSMEPPGFVWFADARLAPLIHMLARDSFVEGKGQMLISLQGFPLVNAKGPEIDLGAGLRFWGEVIAFPEVVLSPYLRWKAISDDRARVEIDRDGMKMSAEVAFDENSLPESFHAMRYRDVEGAGVLTPWTGHCTDWRLIDGRLFPSRWESVWHLPEGDFSAVKLQVLGVVTN